MPDIATALKAEIQRIARKEIRVQTEAIRKASAQHRREIAALKRQIRTLEQSNRALRKTPRARAATATEPPPTDVAARAVRWSAKGFQAHRARLGLSAEALGRLLGVSGQSVYNWERQKATPRAEQLRAIAGLRTMSRRQAEARLAAQD
ncbi:MAG: XRE family transcriptional regulator [Burkholderiales bacterium]|nr:MAG: XRE family transcriptional regulator [Burkholderiales bacterium]